MAGFLPKDYVGVNVRVDQAHEKHKDKLSIETTFDIKDQTVIFNAKVTFGDQVFTGHSFGQVGKEKAFEKLETVAVGRALAFAGFETRDGIASKEEMEVFESNKKESGEEHACRNCGHVDHVEVFEGKYGPCFKCDECGKFSKPNRTNPDGKTDISNPPF